MRIRRITRFSSKIFEAVLNLLPQLAPGAILPTEELFKRILASGNIYFFTGELEDKQVIAMLSIVRIDLLSGKNFRIEDVVVDNSQRGKGYGRELMQFAIDFAKSNGAKSIVLTSRPSRIAANKLYLELGFERYETNVYKYSLPGHPPTPPRGAKNSLK